MRRAGRRTKHACDDLLGRCRPGPRADPARALGAAPAKLEGGVDPGASGQTVLRFPGNVVTLAWRRATSAMAMFVGMGPMAVTVSTTGGITKFLFEDSVYFWVSDRRAAAEQVKALG